MEDKKKKTAAEPTKKRTWDENFQCLVEYKKQHGDCLVPSRYEDTVLVMWMKNIRRTSSKLSDERRKQLAEVGFSFDPQKDRYDKHWKEKFDRLKSYQQEYGDCLVSLSYNEDPELASWVHEQRKHYSSNQLSRDRTDLLNSIGFVWRLRQNIPSDEKWQNQYKKVLEFKKKQGHCRIPRWYEADLAFANWCHSQRNAYKRNIIREDRKKLLEEAGFVWRLAEDTEDQKPSAKKPSTVQSNEQVKKPTTASSITVSLEDTDPSNTLGDGDKTVDGYAVSKDSKSPEDLARVSTTHTSSNEETVTALNSTNDSATKQTKSKGKRKGTKKYVGAKIRKSFGKEWFDGEVVGSGPQRSWHILYDDGDEEDVETWELKEYIKNYKEHHGTTSLVSGSNPKQQRTTASTGQGDKVSILGTDVAADKEKTKTQTNFLVATDSENNKMPAEAASDDAAIVPVSAGEKAAAPRSSAASVSTTSSTVSFDNGPTKQQVLVPNAASTPTLLTQNTTEDNSMTEKQPSAASTGTNLPVDGMAAEEDKEDDNDSLMELPDAYALLCPQLLQLCSSLNCSSSGRKRIPIYLGKIEHWILKEQNKLSRAKKRRRISEE